MRKSKELNQFFKMVNAIDVLDSRDNEIMVWLSDDNMGAHGSGEVTFSKFGGDGSKAVMYCNETVDTTIYLMDVTGDCKGVITVRAETESEFIAIGKDVIRFLKEGKLP